MKLNSDSTLKRTYITDIIKSVHGWGRISLIKVG